MVCNIFPLVYVEEEALCLLQDLSHMAGTLKSVWGLLYCLDEAQEIQSVYYLSEPAIPFELFPHNIRSLPNTRE